MKSFLTKVLSVSIYVVAFVAFYFAFGLSFEPCQQITSWQSILFFVIFFIGLPAITFIGIREDKGGYKLYLIGISSGVMLALAWPPLPFTLLSLGALLPILYVEHQVSDPKSVHYGRRFFKFLYPALLSWNILSTFWVANSTLPGGIAAFTCNAAIMAIPFMLFHRTKRVAGPGMGYLSLIAYYICMEYLHMQWELTWPWLVLGNVFAKYPSMVQWYEYTGHLGGSLWILAVNVLLFSSAVSLPYMRQYMAQRFNLSPEKAKTAGLIISIARPALLIIIPLSISFIIYNTYQEKGKPVEVVTVQPNLDPYTEKFNGSATDQMERFLQLSNKLITDSTRFVVWPETSIPGNVWLNKIDRNRMMNSMMGFVKQHPQVSIVSGVSALTEYTKPETETARYFSDGTCCYDVFNASILLDTSERFPVYVKAKLVPGVERTPYPGVLKVLAESAIDLGGITGSLGMSEHREPLFTTDSIGVAAAICYESVFGGYMTEFMQNGAELIFIVTNDAWWGNTAGHKQHLYYASLRAIEARRDVTRSANTGVSCFIDQLGNIRQTTTYDTPDAIRSTMYRNTDITFFVKYGDQIGRVAGFLTIFFVLYTFVFSYIKKRN